MAETVFLVERMENVIVGAYNSNLTLIAQSDA